MLISMEEQKKHSITMSRATVQNRNINVNCKSPEWGGAQKRKGNGKCEIQNSLNLRIILCDKY